MALPGLAGTTAVPASSALIVRARAFRAWLEPLIPSLRRARLDTGFPAAASLSAATRAWPMPTGLDAAALGSCGAVVVPAGGPDPARGAWGAAWSWAASCLVLGGPGGGPRYCRFSGPVVWSVRCGASIGAEHVGQRSPHGQDQDRQAGHDRGDGPRRPRRPGLGQEVVGHLSGHAECEGADRGPLGEPAGPVADRVPVGQPGAQRVRGVRLDADFAERTWCKHRADLGFHVEDMCDVSGVAGVSAGWVRTSTGSREEGRARDTDLADPALLRRRSVSTDRQRTMSITVTHARPGRCLGCGARRHAGAAARLTLRNWWKLRWARTLPPLCAAVRSGIRGSAAVRPGCSVHWLVCRVRRHCCGGWALAGGDEPCG